MSHAAMPRGSIEARADAIAARGAKRRDDEAAYGQAHRILASRSGHETLRVRRLVEAAHGRRLQAARAATVRSGDAFQCGYVNR